MGHGAASLLLQHLLLLPGIALPFDPYQSLLLPPLSKPAAVQLVAHGARAYCPGTQSGARGLHVWNSIQQSGRVGSKARSCAVPFKGPLAAVLSAVNG